MSNSERVTIIGQYQIGTLILTSGKDLGEGTFGQVKLGVHTPTGEKVAIKILVKEKIVDESDLERVTREIQILKMIRHPNIIQLYEIIEDDTHLYLIMENAEGGELFDYIVLQHRYFLYKNSVLKKMKLVSSSKR